MEVVEKVTCWLQRTYFGLLIGSGRICNTWLVLPEHAAQIPNLFRIGVL
jgi:hypothetical protein